MRILSGPAQIELVRSRSRFLGLLEPVRDAEQARSALKEAKTRFSDADHVVHAFRTGTAGAETRGCSDDGEPSGTAGRPVLDVLVGQGGSGALLLVARWFGGTKLGTGGLVQAYGDCAKAVIAAAVWEEFREWITATVTVTWTEHRLLRNELDAAGARIDHEEFGSDIAVEARLPREAFEILQERTFDLTRGRARWVKKDV